LQSNPASQLREIRRDSSYRSNHDQSGSEPAIFNIVKLKLGEEYLNFLKGKKDIDEGFKKLSNNDLISFLDGLIIQKRGKKEDGTPVPKIKVTKNNLNNILLRKLRIALAFKSYDMIRIFKLGGIEISEGELSALFRREDHKNYKECGDKYVRVFLKGLTEYCRN